MSVESVRKVAKQTDSPKAISRANFYEGKWAEVDLSTGSLRNWLIKKQRFFVTRLLRKRGALLDLGCGGGWRLFAKAGPVAGIDLSRPSLKAAGKIYSLVAVADLAYLPFAEESFDFVVSSDVLGHVSSQRKQQVLNEIYRVLRKGGLTLHYIETEGADPLTRFEKSDPSLYRRYIVEPEGHVGLESPRQAAQRFHVLGFEKGRETACYKMLLYINRFVQYFDNEYRRRSWFIRIAVALCKLLVRAKPLELAANVGVALALEITDRLFPFEWASGLMVEYKK